ncbi:unnamed protein product, partial [Staurois parvus]
MCAGSVQGARSQHKCPFLIERKCEGRSASRPRCREAAHLRSAGVKRL